MKYQNYKLQTFKHFKQDFKKTQTRLVSKWKTLSKTGISTFEKIQKLEFANFYSLIIECGNKEGRAEKKKSTEQRLKLAEKRLNAAKSNHLKKRVERNVWIGLFLKEIESAQMRLNELQRLTENAKCDVEPFKRWFQARQMKWQDMRLKGPEKAEQRIRLEGECAEFQDQNKKLDELRKKAYKTRFARFLAEEELESAEERYNAARLNNFRKTVEKVVLIKMTQKKVDTHGFNLKKKRNQQKKLSSKKNW